MKLIKRRTIYFENENINVIVIDFGASFYVWVGKFSNIELLSVSFPLSNKSISDEFASSSLLGEDELCTSISSYLCRQLKAPILLSINTGNIEISDININEFKHLINKNIVDLIME
ncbi:hypothetical protein cpbgf_8003170 [Cryptosporidium parvum]|uniref:Uncharacterized protein n=1 Tax=Cryptosporidium parvum TaxID=5807 RepID=A0A7S7LDA7_CRYPV|nr:hypothetical protein CPATCC_0003350 [Cryptosporidium parvum]WRK34076.1 hypothetical protein cpbgf_8003170 [Cryptosporidium parvum]|eukprot:QOY40079.1 hypothetical protein CPATCC_004156 [Cryptosporidium parvum]